MGTKLKVAGFVAVGALAGALSGAAALHGERVAAPARRDAIESIAQRCVERERGQALPAVRA